MYLEAFSDNPFSTNCWLLSLEGSEEAVVVDPGFDPERVHGLLRSAGKRPVAVLATHGHYDHVGAAGAFCGDAIPLYIHEDDALALTDPGSWGAGYPAPPAPAADVRTIADGEVLTPAGIRLEVLHTPGHTPGHVCFSAEGFVFSGDLIFAGSIGRSDFPNSSPEDMDKSMRRFLTLADPTEVHPGHGPSTTVGRERRTNPFLLEL